MQGYQIIIGGDFNTKLDSPAGKRLGDWAADKGLVNVMTSLSDERYLTHCYGVTPITSIDHVFADPELISQAIKGSVISDALALEVSDHLPIAIEIQWNINHRSEFSGTSGNRPPKRIELMQYDKNQLDEYAHVMQTWFEINSSDLEIMGPEDGLLQIMKASVDTTYELTKKKRNLQRHVGLRSDFKDGFSPFFYALKLAYRMILTYMKRLGEIPATACRKQLEERYHREYISASMHWIKENSAQKYRNDDDMLNRLSKITEKLSELRLMSRLDLAKLQQCAKFIRGLLHGRLRAEYRKRTSSRLAKMQELYEQNRMGEIFRMINIKNKPDLDLSVLQTKEEILTHPQDIHQQLTFHFSEWYKIPDDLHPAALLWQDGVFWQQLVHGNISYLCNGQGHVAFQEQMFIKTCKRKVSESVALEIAGATEAPISREEYQQEINKMSFGKAPGPTGASASMFKAWPDAIHNQVLNWINEIWCSRDVPSWWLLAHLKPIPKTGEISLDNIRPLGLYEISRKILTAIVIKRIYMAWERLECLNPNQHAFRRGKSTTQAILRVLNISEDTAEHGTPLWQILWDFRRAFDSIQFNFTKLALARLGVPLDIIEFLTNMMELNEMAVASPYHMAEHNFNSGNECSGLKFHQERGTGQGDPPSPIIWIAIFDILLDMLAEQGTNGAFYAHGPATQVYPAMDVAYADDLVTISSSHEAQQKKVDAVCTFCACTGMQIAYAKVKAFAINCEKYAPNIVLHDSNWSSIIIEPCTNSIDMKYLGFKSHHETGDSSAMEYIKEYLREATAHITHCQATRQAKLAVFKAQVIPKVMYTAAKACWTLEQYRELDRFAAPILKHIGRHMHSSPNSMLFFPKEFCGTGINALSDTAQARKWGELTASLYSPGEDQLAAYGLLERALRQTAQQNNPFSASSHRKQTYTIFEGLCR